MCHHASQPITVRKAVKEGGEGRGMIQSEKKRRKRKHQAGNFSAKRWEKSVFPLVSLCFSDRCRKTHFNHLFDTDCQIEGSVTIKTNGAIF